MSSARLMESCGIYRARELEHSYTATASMCYQSNAIKFTMWLSSEFQRNMEWKMVKSLYLKRPQQQHSLNESLFLKHDVVVSIRFRAADAFWIFRWCGKNVLYYIISAVNIWDQKVVQKWQKSIESTYKLRLSRRGSPFHFTGILIVCRVFRSKFQ